MFNFPSQGVLCDDFCYELDLLATGSIDHMMHLWNPYVSSEPMPAQLMVHITSILDVVITKDSGSFIFSYSQDSVSLTDVLMQGSHYSYPMHMRRGVK